MDIDRIKEIETDAAIDALMDGPKVVTFDLVGREEPFIYDTESWHSDVADMITSMDAQENDKLRQYLHNALWWVEHSDSAGAKGVMQVAERVTHNLAEIGRQVLLNAIANGLTAEKLGEVA
jgi:hypothetical protein